MEIGRLGKAGVIVRLIVALVAHDQDTEIVPCQKHIVMKINV